MRSTRNDRARFVPVLRGALLDVDVTIERMSVVNDHLVTWSRLRGVNARGIPALEIPANDRILDIRWIDVEKIGTNHAPARWSIVDVAEIYRQLDPKDARGGVTEALPGRRVRDQLVP